MFYITFTFIYNHRCVRRQAFHKYLARVGLKNRTGRAIGEEGDSEEELEARLAMRDLVERSSTAEQWSSQICFQ